MPSTRRFFLGATAVVGIAALFGAHRVRYGGQVETLATDPEAEHFVYRDGWIEPV